MRSIIGCIIPALAALAILTTVPPPGAQGETLYPWCAGYNAPGGADANCGFVTYDQCKAAVSGVGGWCEENLFYIRKYGMPSRTTQSQRRRRARR
jgi:hypothetical protein